MTTTDTPIPNNNSGSSPTPEDEKCAKIKRFIIFGVLSAVAVIGWHLYGMVLKFPVVWVK